jgi:hypothetical protein
MANISKKKKRPARVKSPPEHYHRDVRFGEHDWFNYEGFYRWMAESFESGSHFVEIGSWTGRSSAFMAVEIWRSGKSISLDCIDTWKGNREHAELREVVDGELYSKFVKNMMPVRGRYRAIRKCSVEAALGYRDRSLDFVFIDGDHTYESVMDDIGAWLPKVRSGGVIGGHDYRVWSGVTRAVHDSFGHDFHQYMGDVWFKVL